ncbi:MAG: RNA polymerase sigma factor [Coprobacillaceae bacterium]
MENDALAQIVQEVLIDKRKFNILYSHIIKRVYYWCYVIVGNKADAEDASQEAITLFYLDEFTVNEIAKILDSDSNNIKARLHKGRKNIEKQITEYQEKNNIKLYSIPILTLLGSSIKDHQEEICSKKDFKYKHNFNYTNTLSIFQNIITVLSSKVAILIVIISITVIALFVFNEISDFTDANSSSDVFFTPEKNGYDRILHIDYDKNLTRSNIPISVTVDNSIKKDDIRVYYEEKEILFTLHDNILFITANVNGDYEIQVKDECVNVLIHNIDKKAPELKGIYNRGEYIDLEIDNQYSTLDYTNSYIEYKGNQYSISNKNKVTGNFKGNVVIVLYDNNGQFVQYDIQLK